MATSESGSSTLEIIRASALGDERAITQLVMSMAPGCLEFVSRRTAGDAELIVNDVLANVLRKLPELEISSSNEFRAYVYRSLRNRLADEGRRHRFALVSLDQVPDASVATQSRSDSNVVDEMMVSGWLEALTPDQRAVISSRFLHDLSIEETARRVGKPVPAVKSLQNRALRSLRIVAGAVAVVAVVLGFVLYRAATEQARLQPVSGDLPQETGDPETGLPDLDGQPIWRMGLTDPEGEPDGPGTGDGRARVGAGQSTPPSTSSMPVVPPVVDGHPASDPGIQAGPGSATTGPDAAAAGGAAPGGPDPARAAPAPESPTTTAAPLSDEPSRGTTPGPSQPPVAVPSCTAIEGSTSVTEGGSGWYRLVLDRPAAEDRTYTLRVVPGSAAWVGNRPGVDRQDIMWGGYYTRWVWALVAGWQQTGIVHDLVPETDGLLVVTTLSDRPMVGPGDATWDYSLVVGGHIQDSTSVEVTVAAGETLSSRVEVKAWRERVTVDRKGFDDGGHTELGESFGLSGPGCSVTVTIVDSSTYSYANSFF